jgi:uncharacterized protein (DUF2062 family)
MLDTADIKSVILVAYIGLIAYVVGEIVVQSFKFYRHRRQSAASQEGQNRV